MLELEPKATTLPQYDPSLKDADGLTNKQRAWADHYIVLNSTQQPGNARRGYGTEAARLAGYSGDEGTLNQVAWANLRLPKVREYIRKKLRLHVMSSDEVLQRLSKQARADLADVLKPDGSFDFKHAKKRGTTDLIRKLKTRTITRTDRTTRETETEVIHELELHNSQSALETMGKFHHLWGDLPESSAPAEVKIGSVQVLVLLGSSLGETIDVTPAPCGSGDERPQEAIAEVEQGQSLGDP